MVAEKIAQLVPELDAYLREEDWGLALRHPLVSMIPYCHSMSKTANRWLVQKSERLEQAIKEREWDLALVLYEKYARIAAFQELAPQMTDEEYWQHLRQTWMEVENLWQYRDLIPGLLAPAHRDKSHRHLMMDEAERRLLNRRRWSSSSTVVAAPPTSKAGAGHCLPSRLSGLLRDCLGGMGESFLKASVIAWISLRFSTEEARTRS